MRDRRNNPGHTNDVFEVIVVQCSMKNYDRSYRSYRSGDKDSTLYYCIECGTMHRNDSRIGKLHKKYLNFR